MSTLGPCFKTAELGPAADARARRCPRARCDGARCVPRSRRRRLHGMTTAPACAAARTAAVHARVDGVDRLAAFHIRPAHRGPHPLPSRQFQALFRLSFQSPFHLSSQYLFAIGLSPVFSLGRNLPPDVGRIPKQPDRRRLVVRQWSGTTGSHLLRRPSRGLRARSAARTLLRTTP